MARKGEVDSFRRELGPQLVSEMNNRLRKLMQPYLLQRWGIQRELRLEKRSSKLRQGARPETTEMWPTVGSSSMRTSVIVAPPPLYDASPSALAPRAESPEGGALTVDLPVQKEDPSPKGDYDPAIGVV